MFVYVRGPILWLLTATHVLKVESTVIQHDSLTSELRRFWDYESLGIQDQSLPLYDKFVGEVDFVEGRYQVRLPFTEDHELLPDNFAPCKLRLASLLKRFSLKPEVSRHYNDVIQEQLKQGIIELVEQGVNSGVDKVHYIPHHEVIRVVKQSCLLFMTQVPEQGETHQASMTVCMQVHPCLSTFMMFYWGFV